MANEDCSPSVEWDRESRDASTPDEPAFLPQVGRTAPRLSLFSPPEYE